MAGTQQRAGTRERIVYAGAELFRRQGYAGTGLKQVVTLADAPFGSLYHFFPGGKEQLADEVVRQGGDFFLRLFEAVVDPAPDVATGIGDFFAGAAETLRATDYADACPIATVALEVASTNEMLRVATSDVFESWLGAATDRLAGAGLPGPRAREAAVAVLALLEGAFVLARATRDARHVEVAGEAAVALVCSALTER